MDLRPDNDTLFSHQENKAETIKKVNYSLQINRLFRNYFDFINRNIYLF